MDKKKGRSERRNELKKILSLIAVLAILLMGTVPAMAHIEYFADDGIWSEVPEGWSYDEDIYDQDSYRHIAAVYNDESSYDIWYCNDNAYDYSQFYSEEGALDYFNTFGDSVLTDFLYSQGYYNISYNEPEYFAGDYQDFIKVKVETDAGKEYVYITCSAYDSASILYMHPNGHKIHPDKIAKSFCDYSYTENLKNSGGSHISEFFNDGEWFDVLVPAVVIIGAIVSVLKSLLGERKEKKAKEISSVNEVKRVVKRIKPSEGHHEKDTEGGVKQTAYTGCTYEDSLRTLYKSGLLTRQQLNEMLEKHNGGRK